MQAESRAVTSNQAFLHPKLVRVVQRHLQSPSKKPLAAHNREAFKALQQRINDAPQALVIDSFCGTGQSTAILAERHPDHLVVGIDQSAHRLERHVKQEASNYLLLRAQCEDIWQLILQEQWQVDFHYLLYPNPWPKSAHLQRRIHGHPSFLQLVQLGGKIELRSNWQSYVEEFGLAMSLAGGRGVVSQIDEAPITLFEKKYRASGHALWRYRGQLALA